MFASFPPPTRNELETLAQTELDNWILPDSASGVTIQREFRHGDPTSKILAYAYVEFMDLVVLGAQGQRNLEDYLVGSVTEKVVRKAACPVLVVHPDDSKSN